MFRTFVDDVTGPTLRLGQVVILDNCRAHKAAGVPERSEPCGARLLSLSLYAPNLHPIEIAWRKAKARLQGQGQRTLPALIDAVGPALASISPQDARGSVRHCSCALR